MTFFILIPLKNWYYSISFDEMVIFMSLFNKFQGKNGDYTAAILETYLPFFRIPGLGFLTFITENAE